MRLGPRLVLPAVALAVVVAPTLTGCALFDTGSTVDEAFEYLPADTFSVQFADRAAMAERLELDDVDPRDVSDRDFERFLDAFDPSEPLHTTLTPFVAIMRDDSLNDFDIEWEAVATWEGGNATVWKVGDELDFDALADDLTETGYERDNIGDFPAFTGSLELADGYDIIGDAYPTWMLNVLLDEDERLVVSATERDPLGDVAEVISDDADSLADDGGLDNLLDAAEGDPELAMLTTGGPAICGSSGRPLPEQAREQYDDLGRPDARALFISADDPKVQLALQFNSDDAAKDDLEAREALIEDGADIHTQEPLGDLGDFELEQDGEFVLIEEDFEGGTAQAVRAELDGGGPGLCLPENAD